MVITPMIRNNICLNSHPAGCVKVVENQIEHVKNIFGDTATSKAGLPRLALVAGCSTGYGLASRICAAFGFGAATVGLSFEKAGSEKKPGTPGFYNNLAFEKSARAAGLACETLNTDAFSAEAKTLAAEAVRRVAKNANVPAKIDLLIYSLASPVRTDPKTGIMHKSVIKPIGAAYSGETIDMMTGEISTVSAEAAQEEEIANTIKVMGGEDWELWFDALKAEGLLSENFRTVAYTYIGPRSSWAIYKNGTIGRAKEDLERAAKAINARAGKVCAFVSVNKAVVTRASAVIPVIPLYISCLFKVMKAKKLHEGCIEQIIRLFRERLYTTEAAKDPSKTECDGEGRIRIDDWEMREDVQSEVAAMMKSGAANSDIPGYRHDFLEAHGFDVAGVDYGVEVKTEGI